MNLYLQRHTGISTTLAGNSIVFQNKNKKLKLNCSLKINGANNDMII